MFYTKAYKEYIFPVSWQTTPAHVITRTQDLRLMGDSAHTSSLAPSAWWIIEVWIVEYAYYHLCHGPIETPPTPPLCLHLRDGSWRSRSWNMPTTNYSYTQSYSLIVLLLCFNVCNDSFCTHGIYYTRPSWRGILLCCSPEGFFTFFSVVWEFFLIRCEVKGQGCLCVQIVKHSETNL